MAEKKKTPVAPIAKDGTAEGKKQALETLQEERKQKKESYNKRLEVLRDYQNELLTL